MGETRSFISNLEGPWVNETVRAFPKPEGKKKDEKVTNYSLNRTQNGLKRTGKGLKRSWFKPKTRDPEVTEQENSIRNEVIERENGLCYVCQKEGNEKPGTECHHILFKQKGGRGVLKELIDSIPLRVLLSYNCHHNRVHEYEITAYDFYMWAFDDDYQERVILMEILINEWAKYVPLEKGEIIDQIRERNRQRWKQITGEEVEVKDPKMIALHWEEILRLEVA